jgi:hypothetical protein
MSRRPSLFHRAPALVVGGAAAASASSRRFAPPAGFHCGALHVEATAEGCDLVWGNGSRVPCPGVTLARAIRLVARGTWVELPEPRPRQVR